MGAILIEPNLDSERIRKPSHESPFGLQMMAWGLENRHFIILVQ
jgi:hypothetical protein